MNKAAFDINTFWFYTVFLHIAGSIIFSLLGFLPLGTMLGLTGLWGIGLYLSDKSRKTIGMVVIGWLITGAITLTMPVSYGSSLLMNLLMLLLVYYVCRLRQVSVWEYCAFKKIPFRQWGILLLLTIAFLVIASYINAVSMLFVQNMTAVSLQGTGHYFLQSILVFAIFPAVAEEILFRGYIFRGIINKNVAVIVSALMFALLHMNFNQMSYAFIMGLLFALVVRITDNLSATVLIHLLFNFYNIFTAAFPENPAASFFQGINIGGYHLMAASFLQASGSFDFSLLVIGTVTVAAAFIVVAVLLWILKKVRKEEKDLKTEQRVKEGLPWKPDRTFWVGCAACAAIAVSYEFII